MESKHIVYAVLIVGVLVEAAMSMHPSSRPVAEFAESLIAVILYWGSILFSFASSVYLGIKSAEKSRMTWIGWVVGIVIFAVAAVATSRLSSAIPGVGWRIEQREASVDSSDM